ncbi:hypothetical protein LTR84_002446 [Exophiala bonariae]|uniref:FAD-binding FR-type domain-containing protein n=1 Tax=Exophiala bonariae TaxID=1690606 RepID=A0AAV9ND97_9EURO|nr:hypothetical protein LTR84_002446 [Exophiala bonariae]
MELKLFLAAFIVLLGGAVAVDPATDCLEGTLAAVQMFGLGDPEAGYYENMCQNMISVMSMWAAAKLYCTPKEIEAGFNLYAPYCTEYGGVELISYSEVLPLLTDEYITSLPVVGLEEMNAGETWNTSILISKDLWLLGSRSEHEYDRQYTLHKRYGWAVYGFWGGFLVIGMANRLISHLYNSRRSRTTTNLEGLGDLPFSSAKSSVFLAPVKTIPGNGYYALSWEQQYWYMGAMATVTMSLLLGLSSIYLRLKHYEIFLVLHIILSILTIVGLFYHTWVFTTKEYDPYLWPCVAIWLFDRVARLVRLGYCNIRARRSGSLVFSTATATYNKDADLIRVVVFPGSRLLHPGPGQHYYIYQLNKFRFWENHPFTLAASYPSKHDIVKQDGGSKSPSDTGSLTGVIQKEEPEVTSTALLGDSGPSSPSPASTSSLESPAKDSTVASREDNNRLVFLIRPFNSWTKRLRDECTRAGPSGLTKSSLRIEGPYGHDGQLLAFENIIFVVGGTGIAGAIPYLQEHLRLSSIQTSSAKGTRAKNLTVIWAAKQSAMIHDVINHELGPFLCRDDIRFSFHATREKKTRTTSKTTETDEKMPLTSGFEILNSRPDISGKILGLVDQVNSAGSKGGRIAVLTCGPGAMADEARAAVHQGLKQGKRGLEYFEEAFG